MDTLGVPVPATRFPRVVPVHLCRWIESTWFGRVGPGTQTVAEATADHGLLENRIFLFGEDT